MYVFCEIHKYFLMCFKGMIEYFVRHLNGKEYGVLGTGTFRKPEGHDPVMCMAYDATNETAPNGNDGMRTVFVYM